MYCPRCGSDRLNFMPWLGMVYECYDCKYRGPVAVGKIEKLKTLKNREKSKKA